MVEVNSSELITEFVNQTGISSPNLLKKFQVSPLVIPTLELHPRLIKCLNVMGFGERTVTGNGAVYTVPARGRFYLYSIVASMIKDVVCDSAAMGVQLYLEGNSSLQQIVSFPVLTITAQNNIITINFPTPLILAKGTLITVSGTYTAGTAYRCCNIHGYHDTSAP